MKVLSYQRVSTARQNFDRQDAYAREFCELNGFELVDTFRDRGFAGDEHPRERPAFREVEAAIAAQRGDLVVVSEMDRLTRDAGVATFLGELLPCPIVLFFECWSTRSLLFTYRPEFLALQWGLP